MISVNLAEPRDVSASDWADLTRRSSSNVFMNPAALQAVRDVGFSTVRVLTAWADSEAGRTLVGLWALQVRKPGWFWPTLLEARPYDYAFLSSPVIDPAFVDQVIPAFVAAVKRDRSLPNVISMKDLDAEAPSHAALVHCLASQGCASLTLAQSARPIVTREFGIKKSGSTRKKLRQDWNRLSALGQVDVVNSRDPDDVAAALEAFLALEAASWKGSEGTAILCNDDDAAFVRRLVNGLAGQGHASVALLRLDGRAVAAQVLMFCGATAYTWKTAYDAEYGRFSPGALLIDKVTEEVFAMPGIDTIDSCSAEGSFMAQLWSGRRAMVDLLVDVGGAGSITFLLERNRQHGIQMLRRLRDGFQDALKKRKRRKTTLAPSPPQQPAAG